MEWLTNPHTWIALVTLTALEIVLGIDNIVFISILAGKLPPHQQPRARRVGLSLAMVTRIILLCSLSFMVKLTGPIFTLLHHGVSGRDLILIGGGLFLLAKSVHEIHDKLEGVEGHRSAKVAPSFVSVLITIALLDIVFSLDSVITAVGMVDELGVMIAAVILAVCVMLLFSDPVSNFVESHPTIKMLALSFLLLIGTTLIMEGVGAHVPKGYVYFAMGFSLFVEMLNIRMGARQPLRFHYPYTADSQSPNRDQSFRFLKAPIGRDYRLRSFSDRTSSISSPESVETNATTRDISARVASASHVDSTCFPSFA